MLREKHNVSRSFFLNYYWINYSSNYRLEFSCHVFKWKAWWRLDRFFFQQKLTCPKREKHVPYRVSNTRIQSFRFKAQTAEGLRSVSRSQLLEICFVKGLRSSGRRGTVGLFNPRSFPLCSFSYPVSKVRRFRWKIRWIFYISIFPIPFLKRAFIIDGPRGIAENREFFFVVFLI